MVRNRLLLWTSAVIGMLILVFFLYCLLFSKSAPDSTFVLINRTKPLVIAHRGGKGLWPENTLIGFTQAVKIGVDILEMDVNATADAVPVVIHDASVDRTTNGQGLISEMTLEELIRLDAGYQWTDDNGHSFPYRGTGYFIPTLEEVLRVFPNQALNIEIKPVDPVLAESVCDLILQYGVEENVLIASFDLGTLTTFRRSCPRVATSLAEDEVRTLYLMNLFWLGCLFSPNGIAVQVPEYSGSRHVLNQRFITTAQGRNLQVHAWTINEKEDMKRLLDLGVDGIITDYPNRLMELLAR